MYICAFSKTFYNAGICYRTAADPREECEDNGFYKIRLCFENDDDNTECVCVQPENGTRLEDTRIVLRNDNKKPKCKDIGKGLL